MEYIGYILLSIGLIFIVFGSVFILLLPDFYYRLLACSQIDTLGMLITILGLLFVIPDYKLSFKIVVVLFITLSINPITTYSIGRSAFLKGEKPKLKKGDR